MVKQTFSAVFRTADEAKSFGFGWKTSPGHSKLAIE
jgi:hypothetical protein